MAYSIFLYSLSEKRPAFATIRELVQLTGEGFSLEVNEGTKRDWKALWLGHRDGNNVIGILDWMPVRPNVSGDEGAELIEDILEGLDDYVRPACNVAWLREFLPNVRSLFTWSIYSGADVNEGWDAVDTVIDLLCIDRQTAIHYENEAWHNNEGDLISLETPGPASDDWPMALYLDDQWHKFIMRTGNQKSRACFLAGKVPPKTEVEIVPAKRKKRKR